MVSFYLTSTTYISPMFHFHCTLSTTNSGTPVVTLIHLAKSHKEHISFLYICSPCHKLTVDFVTRLQEFSAVHYFDVKL